MTETKLWTLITFFGWVILHHIVPNVLDIGKDHLSKVCSFFEQPKKNDPGLVEQGPDWLDIPDDR